MSDIVAQETKNGTGVFAGHDFEKGEEVLLAKGRILRAREIAKNSYDDLHGLQIEADIFIGASGEIDDYVNHACEPNAGYVIKGHAARLVAIKKINSGDEITFDYSSNINDSSFHMECNCGSLHCRKTIGDFNTLPEKTKKDYIQLGIVPGYLLNRD